MADVVLLDGRTVDTWSWDWLIECRDREIEARKVLDLPTKEQRRYYLAGVGRDRGPEAQVRLEATVRGLWERRQARGVPVDPMNGSALFATLV